MTATSEPTHLGYQIKRIDTARNNNPTLDEKLQGPETYTVYLILKPIRNFDHNALPEIEIEILQLWKEFFTEVWKRHIDRKPRNLPTVKFVNHRNSGRLVIEKTNLRSVEEHCDYLMELVDTVNHEAQKTIKEKVNYQGKNEEYQKRFREQAEQINSKCFSKS